MDNSLKLSLMAPRERYQLRSDNITADGYPAIKIFVKFVF